MPRVYTMAEVQAGGTMNFWCDSNGCYRRDETPPTIYQVTGQDPVRRRLEEPTAVGNLSQKLEKPVGTAERAVEEFYYGGRMPVMETGLSLRGIGNAVWGGVKSVLGTAANEFTSNVSAGAADCAKLILRPIDYAACMARAGVTPGTVMTTGAPTYPNATPVTRAEINQLNAPYPLVCPPGQIRNQIGACIPAPAGAVGSNGYAGSSSVGAMGIPAMQPMAIMKQRLVCPPGLVLGRDNLCYVKGTIPRKYRKWKQDARPPLTAGDAKAIRRAAGAKRRVRKLAGAVGLAVKAKGSNAGTQKGPRRK